MPSTIILDIETSPVRVDVWDLYPDRINHDNIVEDWRILCIAWKKLGSKKTEAVSCFDDGDYKDDKNVLKAISKVLMAADYVVAHNGKRFDMKKITARLIYHNLPPIPPPLVVDTLTSIKKIAKFTSHRLDYLSKHFGYEGKLKTGFELWKRATAGDEVAMQKMVRYCREDVRQLEKVYERMKPYFVDHPVLADVLTLNCPTCNSPNVSKHKPRVSARGIWSEQYQCNNCYHYFTSRKALSDKSLSK